MSLLIWRHCRLLNFVLFAESIQGLQGSTKRNPSCLSAEVLKKYRLVIKGVWRLKMLVVLATTIENRQFLCLVIFSLNWVWRLYRFLKQMVGVDYLYLWVQWLYQTNSVFWRFFSLATRHSRKDYCCGDVPRVAFYKRVCFSVAPFNNASDAPQLWLDQDWLKPDRIRHQSTV